MTSTPTLPALRDSIPPAPPARIAVVVVTGTDPTGLPATLAAVRAQTRHPDSLVVVDRTDGSLDADGDSVTDILTASAFEMPTLLMGSSSEVTLRQAAASPRLIGALDGYTLAWFVPVGVVPGPDALRHLADAWRRSPSTGMVGPKHLASEDPSRLRALTLRATRTGRILAGPRAAELDQGQADDLQDVVAVPFPGALIEVDLYRRLRGPDPDFGDVAADLDLGWRSQLAGRRVVVEPDAEVLTDRGLAPVRANTPGRRMAAGRVALTRASWFSVPFVGLWMALTSLGVGSTLLLLKRPRAAFNELAVLGSLDPVRVTSARWRSRGQRTLARRHVRSVFEPAGSVRALWADGVSGALIKPRPPAAGEQELAPRSWVRTALTHPGALAVIASSIVAVIAGRTLGWSVVRGSGMGLTGGELVGHRVSSSALWHSWRDGWHGAGLGGDAPVSPLAALMAAPTWLLAHIPLAPKPGSPGGLLVALLVFAAIPAAALAAYLAARATSAGPVMRGVAAVLYATSPVAMSAVAGGRLGAVLALVLVPAVVAGLLITARRRATATTGFATAMAICLLSLASPVLAGLGVLAALVILVARPGARVFSAVIAAVPLIVMGPWIVRVAETQPLALLAGPGMTAWGERAPSAAAMVLLSPGDVPGAWWWAGAVIVALTVGALARQRAWLSPRLLALAVVLALVAGAAFTPRLVLSSVPDGLTQAGAAITPWVGTLLIPATLLSLFVVATAFAGLDLSASRRLVLAGRGVGVALAAAVLASVTIAAWGGLGNQLSAWRDPRPAVSIEQANGPYATRALILTPGPVGVGYRLDSRDAATLTRDLPDVSAADAALAPAITSLFGQSPDVAPLADAGIDVIAIEGDPGEAAARALDSTAGLSELEPARGWRYWRVSPDAENESLVANPRLRLEGAGGDRLVATTGANGATRFDLDGAGGTLAVAQPRGWSDVARVRVDGVTLRAQASSGPPTYEIPTGTTRLDIDLADPYLLEHGWELLAGFVLTFLAIPFGRRESRIREIE